MSTDQVHEMEAKPVVWRPLAVQIKDHNDNRMKQCNKKDAK